MPTYSWQLLTLRYSVPVLISFAAALALILFAIILALTIFQLRVLQPRWDY